MNNLLSMSSLAMSYFYFFFPWPMNNKSRRLRSLIILSSKKWSRTMSRSCTTPRTNANGVCEAGGKHGDGISAAAAAWWSLLGKICHFKLPTYLFCQPRESRKLRGICTKYMHRTEVYQSRKSQTEHEIYLNWEWKHLN